MSIFQIKQRYLNFREEDLGDRGGGDPYSYGGIKTPDGVNVNPVISPMASRELTTDTPTRNRLGPPGFNQFSMKPLETRNNNDTSVNTVFANGMNRMIRPVPKKWVQPLPSRYQILVPKPDEFQISWGQPNDGNNEFELL
jgi:hypothetical protein